MTAGIMDCEDLETTLQCEAVYIPPAARRDEDEDADRTLVVAPTAMASLARRSVPPAARTREPDLRLAVFGIWTVAALLVALLVVLAK